MILIFFPLDFSHLDEEGGGSKRAFAKPHLLLRNASLGEGIQDMKGCIIRPDKSRTSKGQPGGLLSNASSPWLLLPRPVTARQQGRQKDIGKVVILRNSQFAAN